MVFLRCLLPCLMILVFVSMASAQNAACLQIIRKKNDKPLFQIREGAKITYTDKEEHIYSGQLRIVGPELIAVGKDTLPLNGFEQLWEQKKKETAFAVGGLALGAGACFLSFKRLFQFAAADSGSPEAGRFACASMGLCLGAVGLFTGGIIQMVKLHQADGDKHKIVIVRKEY